MFTPPPFWCEMEDLSDQYNTPLSPEEEQAFQSWAGPRVRDTYDYDLRGAYKDSGGSPIGEGHFPDTYKKPNHPTFSNESIYHGKDGHEGGSWGTTPFGQDTFTPGRTNLESYGPQGLQDYFNRIEPQGKLILPQESQ